MARKSASQCGRSDEERYRQCAANLEALCRASFRDIGCHGWEHVVRVRALAASLGEREGADLTVLDAAAVFHDTKRGDEDHAFASAKFAEAALLKEGFSRAFATAVSGAISTHSFSSGRVPETIEAKVLADADRIDAMGALGIYRTVQYNLEHSLPAPRIAEHIREKLLKLPAMMHTASARHLAEERIHVLRLYLSALESELSEARSSK
jgi:uncharacterized protein